MPYVVKYEAARHDKGCSISCATRKAIARAIISRRLGHKKMGTSKKVTIFKNDFGCTKAVTTDMCVHYAVTVGN